MTAGLPNKWICILLALQILGLDKLLAMDSAQRLNSGCCVTPQPDLDLDSGAKTVDD